VIKAAELLAKHRVSYNILAVVNDYSAQFPTEVYTFLTQEALPPEVEERFLQFIPIVETNPETGGAAPFSVSGEALGKFLCQVFDCWLADFKDGWPTVSIRFFDTLFHSFVVEHNGDVYSCDFFVEPEWKLGNLMKDKLIDLLNSPRQQEFARMKATLPQPCLECRWLQMCRGACTKDRIRDATDKGLCHFCTSFKMFFEHADAEFRRLAEKWQRGERPEVRPAQ
jgi:uncharacterized protein